MRRSQHATPSAYHRATDNISLPMSRSRARVGFHAIASDAPEEKSIQLSESLSVKRKRAGILAP